MDQQTGAGHHIITQVAVHELFASGRADAHGQINGMTENQYFHALDRAQEYQDRLYGPTTHPAHLDGAAQRQHGMADPHLSGAKNLEVDRNYVEKNLTDARHGDQMTHLGAAVHALEDSYSEAHAWRGSAANHGDPKAPIESFNVFNPLPSPHQHTWGVFGTEGTHDARFDHVPVGKDGELIRGTDKAAAHAVAQALGAFHDSQRQGDGHAQAAIHAKIGEFYGHGASGVKVNDVFTNSWAHERDHRLETHHNEVLDYDHAHGTDHFSKIPVLEDVPVIGPIIHEALGHGPHAALDPGLGAPHDPGQHAYDPGHAGVTAAYDPGHAGVTAAYDPGHAGVTAAYDPGHGGVAAAAYDPGQQSYDPGHTGVGAAAYDPGQAGTGHTGYDAGHGTYDSTHAHQDAHAAEIAGHASGNEIG
jgi:hypothetical protein